MRHCIKEPIPAVFAARNRLVAAVDAHLAGDFESAQRNFKAANSLAVFFWLNPCWYDVEKNVVTRTPTINELTVFMTLGMADAALLTQDQVDPQKLDAVSIPAGENEVLVVPVGSTLFTKHSSDADAFVTFLSSDEGKAIFARHGFPSYPDPAYTGVQPWS